MISVMIERSNENGKYIFKSIRFFIYILLILIIYPKVYSASWIQTSDEDFNAGILSSGIGTMEDSIRLLEGTIIKKTETLPTARFATSAVYSAVNNKIYIFGGYYDGIRLSDIIEYDVLTGSVIKKNEELPTERNSFSAVYFPPNNKIYIFGWYLSNDIVEYDPSTGAVVKMTETLPTPRGGTSAVYCSANNKIYIFGGFDSSKNTFFSDIIEYDPSSGAVLKKAETLPTARTATSAVYFVLNNKIYIFGGHNSDEWFSDIVEYDPSTGAVVKMTETLPTARIGTSAVYCSANSKIYIFGGESYLSDIVEYNPSVNAIVKRSEILPTGRHWTSAVYCSANNNIYIFGGQDYTGYLSDIIEYIPIGFSSGTFISQIRDCNKIALWGNIFWSVDITAESDINLQTRTSNDGTNWSSWSSSYTISGATITSPSARYIQVKANFSTTISTQTPILYDFTITYNCSPSTPTNSSPVLGESLPWNKKNPTFSWSDFYDIDGDTQSAFQVQLRFSTGTYGDISSEDSGIIVLSSNTWTPSNWNLSPGNTYYWRVRVKDNSGFDNAWSTWSAETTFYIKYNIPPNKPVNSSPSSNSFIGDSNPEFNWSEFNDADEDYQVSFQVQLRISTGTYGDGNSKDSGEVSSSTNTYTPSNWNLSTGSYYWRVRVKDNSGFDNCWSEWSDETKFIVDLSSPTGKPSTPSDEGTSTASSSIKFTWTAGTVSDTESGITGYWLQVSTSPNESNYKYDGNVGNVLEYTITNCEDRKTYYARVKAINGVGLYSAWSEWSDGIKVWLTAPEKPTNINVSLLSGETEISDNEILNITGTAEPGTICEIFVKDQNGRTLAGQKLNVGDDGQISAQISLGKITENYPLATQIQVEVSLIDPEGHKSPSATSSFVVFKAEEEKVKLYDNLINPTNGKPMTIGYELPSVSHVTIKILNRDGDLIKKIVDNQLMGAGVYTAEWSGKNTGGNIVASGIYIIHIKTDSYNKILKAIVVK